MQGALPTLRPTKRQRARAQIADTIAVAGAAQAARGKDAPRPRVSPPLARATGSLARVKKKKKKKRPPRATERKAAGAAAQDCRADQLQEGALVEVLWFEGTLPKLRGVWHRGTVYKKTTAGPRGGTLVFIDYDESGRGDSEGNEWHGVDPDANAIRLVEQA